MHKPGSWRGLRSLLRLQDGAVLALAAVFLPVAVLCTGMVVDLGAAFFVRKAVQAACDLGALAGVQELDWDRLASGKIIIRVDEGVRVASEVAQRNLDAVRNLVQDLEIVSTVANPPAKSDPVVTVTARYSVRMPFLGAVPGLAAGFRARVSAEASVLRRTKW